jgi:hypothetical protein
MILALSVLALLWLIWLPVAGLLFQLAGESTYRLYDRVPNWLLYSVYLIFAGSALAWRTAGPLPALLSLTVAAAVPVVLQSLRYFIQMNQHDNQYPNLLILLTCSLIALFLTLLWSRRYFQIEQTGTGTRFGPSGPTPTAWHLLNLDQPLIQQALGRRATLAPPASRYSALLWQSWHQNGRWLLALGTFAVLAIALGSRFLFAWGGAEVYSKYSYVHTVTVLSLAVGTLLSLIWMGSLVFLSDSSGRRISFLSDRGVAPGLTWATRHALPATIAILAVCLGVALARLDLKAIGETECLILVLMAWLLYGASQWTAQVIPSVTLAFLAAPLCSLMMLFYFALTMSMLGTPLILMMSFFVIPLAATWHGMRTWMDRSHQRKFYLTHLGWLLAILVIPVMPLAWSAFNEPKLSASIEQEMLDLLKDQPAFNDKLPGVVLRYSSEQSTPTYEHDAGPSDDSPQHKSLLDHQREVMQDLSNQLAKVSTGVAVGNNDSGRNDVIRACQYLHSICQLTRLSWLKQPATDESLKHYRTAVQILQKIAYQMRLNQSILAQDLADVVEIWLLAELEQPESLKNMGENVYASLVKQIGDIPQRKAARRLAVARSFQIAQQDRESSTLGGYGQDIFQHGSMFGLPQGLLQNWLFQFKRQQIAAGDLWLLASASPAVTVANPPTSESPTLTSVDRELLQRIARFWDRSPSIYGLIDTIPSARVDDVRNTLAVHVADQFVAPGLQWNAGWERQAAVLLKELPNVLQSAAEQRAGDEQLTGDTQQDEEGK